MGEQTKQQQTWWHKHSKLLMRLGLIALVVGVIVLIILIILGYIFNWDWTGLTATDKSKPATNIIVYQPGKTLWDWLGLLGVLAIPVVVGFGAVWFTRTQQLSDQAHEKLQHDRDQEAARIQHDRDQQLAEQRANSEQTAIDKRAQIDRDIAQDNQREVALQAYFDKMSELLLHEHLGDLTSEGESKHEFEVTRNIACARTLTVLQRLDATRKASVLQFLYEAGLINKVGLLVDLMGANLNEASLFGANLKGADLKGASLFGANLSNGDLREVNLQTADLRGANLSETVLIEANLTSADLTGANLLGANLSRANLLGVSAWEANLKGVNLEGADLRGAVLHTSDLSLANLLGANLSETSLSGADLSGAILKDAKNITIEELEKQAKSLKGAIMPDGSRHP